MTIGGDHTIALPLLRALHAIHGPIAVVHFDAHLDTWDHVFRGGNHSRNALLGGRQKRASSTSPRLFTLAFVALSIRHLISKKIGGLVSTSCRVAT